MEDSDGLDDGDALPDDDREKEGSSTIEEATSTPTMTQFSLVPVFEIPHTKPLQTNPYETYATLFPNPNLNAEIMERESLLKAISAADHAVAVNPKPAKSSWFSWGSKKQETDDLVKIDLEDDDRLVYSETLDETSAFPMTQIDYSAIPIEAHALARYQMVKNSRFAESEEGTVDLMDGRLFDVNVNHRVSLPNGTCFVASAAFVLVYHKDSRSPVAQIPPSPAIFQKLAEHFFLQHDDDTALLQIVGLRIISQSILAIARLGGFLEFVDVGDRQKPTVALTTSEYHTDLLGIESFEDAAIVAYGGMLESDADVSIDAAGEGVTSTSQVITIWKYEDQDSIQLLQVIPLDVPSSSMIFSNSSSVTRYWRTPRAVRLRSPEDGPPIPQRSPTNVSFPTPITQIAIGADRWAVVDGLGGVTIYNVESTSLQVTKQHDRSRAARKLDIAPIASAAFEGDLLFLLSNEGELFCWNDGSSVQVSPFARCLLQSKPIRIVVDEPNTTRIAMLQTSVGTDTVGMLIQTGNIQQALSIGKHLGSPDLEACRKELWLESRDFSILSDIKDTSYIIQQAMDPVDMSLKLYRDVCRLAALRIDTARLGELVSFASSAEDSKTIANSLKEKSVSCGTYELLCAHLEYDPTLKHYLDDFSCSSMHELALHFASAGDMASLSLILVRHPSTNLLEILDAIPLATEPVQFGHLLTFRDRKEQNAFFISHDIVKVKLDCFVSYVETTFGLNVTLEEYDREIFLKQNPPRINLPEIEAWFLKRATAMSNFLGSISNTKQITEIAILFLQESTPDKAEISTSLVFLHQFTDMLCTMAADESGSFITSPLATMNPQSLGDLGTKELISIVLTGSAMDSVNIQRRYKHLLMPLLELRHADMNQLDNHIASACLEAHTTKDDILGWMNQSVELLRASRLSVGVAERIIKDPVLCLDTVLVIANQVFSFARDHSWKDDTMRKVVELLWQIFECLPEQSTFCGEPICERLRELSELASKLYVDLIALDICSGWSGTSGGLFRLFPIQFGATTDKQELLQSGHAVASLMCKSLCSQLAHAGGDNGIKDVIATLLADVKEMNRLCFQGALDLRSIMCNSLARPLLLAHKVIALGYLFELARPDILDAAQLSDEVLTIYNAAVYGEESSEEEIRAAAQFRDVLGRWMPMIVDDFAASGRFLDASHMISNDLNANQEVGVLLPKDIRRMRPIEVIDLVMNRNPSCITQHWRNWDDEQWAMTANSHFRQHFQGNNVMHFPDNDRKQPQLPPLPGIPIFKLAELIGLGGSVSAVAVKARIIHYGVKAALYGASAAVCRTLLADCVAVDIDSVTALEAAALIVGLDEYQDVATKRELCIQSLQLTSNNTSRRKAVAVGKIICSFENSELDWMSTRLFANGSVQQLAEDTQKAYSISLLGLVTSLQKQMRDLVFDDDLLVLLARYTFYWCIGRATKPLLFPYHPFYPIATNSTVKLACALSLQVADSGKFEHLNSEINATFSTQMENSLTRRSASSQAKWTVPDNNLVKRLVGRGYSECGARRAVGMTNNAGFDIAVRWAVQHSLDENFDDPIILVRPVKDVRIDDDSVRICQSHLAQLHGYRLQQNKPALTSKLRIPDGLIDDKEIAEGVWSDDDGFDFDDEVEEVIVANSTGDKEKIIGDEVLPASDPCEELSEDAAIVGGWNDHDEIDLDAGLDEVHNASGWGEDEVDLNTILEGENETSELMITTQTRGTSKESDMNTTGGLSGGSQNANYHQYDANQEFSEFLENRTNASAIKPDAENMGWDDDVDLEDFSDSSHHANFSTELHDTSTDKNDADILVLANVGDDGNSYCDKMQSQEMLVSNGGKVDPETLCLATQTTKVSLPLYQDTEPANGLKMFPSVSEQEKDAAPRIPSVSPRSAPLPRSQLIQVGQAAFANARKSGSPSNAERQRLIEQGRAFLKEMKSSSSKGSLSRLEGAKQSFFPDSSSINVGRTGSIGGTDETHSKTSSIDDDAFEV